MEKKIKIFKTIAIILIIITLSLISFVGVFRNSLNSMVNLIPDFVYGMELGGTRELKFTLSDTSSDKEVYVDDNGKYMGDVPADDSSNENGISLDATVDEQGDKVAKEEAEKPAYKTETRTIKANDDSVLNQESYEESKRIIQERLEQAQIPEYNIRLNNITGDLTLEVPEDDNTQVAFELASAQAKLEIVDGQTGVVLLSNEDVKKAVPTYYADEHGYQAYLQIEFVKEKHETLKEISKNYIKITNENNEEETKTIKLLLDGDQMLETYFGQELSSGILQITMGEETSDSAAFSKSYESAAFFANIINNGKTPNAYTISSDNFVKSQITDDLVVLAKVAFAGLIAIVSLVMIVKYKANGVLGAISSVGYIAVTLLAIRYTSVTITLNSLIALLGVATVNYVFMFNYLRRFKTDSRRHAFTESLKEITITIIPLWVVAVIFTFMTSVTINSVGMIMFWGLFVHLIYSTIITRTLYVD